MKKEKYVDGFVLVIPQKNVEEYKKMAKEGAKIWKKYGALDYKECMGDDMGSDMGGGVPLLAFPKMTKAKEGEDGVVFVHNVQVARAPRSGQ